MVYVGFIVCGLFCLGIPWSGFPYKEVSKCSKGSAIFVKYGWF